MTLRTISLPYGGVHPIEGATKIVALSNRDFSMEMVYEHEEHAPMRVFVFVSQIGMPPKGSWFTGFFTPSTNESMAIMLYEVKA
jgi:hypothetical protein